MQDIKKAQQYGEAIKFEYTKAGVDRLKAFAGENVGSISKARRPGARAEAQIRIPGSEVCVAGGVAEHRFAIAYEGDWIVKDKNGECRPMDQDLYYRSYDMRITKLRSNV